MTDKKKALAVKKIADSSGATHREIKKSDKQGTYGVKVNNRPLGS
jgi:hypothetical protein